MAISGRNKRRTRTRSADELARIKEGTRQALLGAAEIGLFLIPGGAIIRLSRVGGKFLPGAVDKLMRKFPGAKQIKNPSKAQIEKAQPPSSVKPKVRVPAKTRTTPNTSKEAGRGGTPPKTKPRVRVPAKTRTTPNTAKEAGRTKLTPKGKKLVAAGATGAAAGLTALGLAGKSAYDAITKKDNKSPRATSGPATRGSNRPANRRNTTAMPDAQKRRQVSKSTAPGMSAAQKRRQVSKSTSPTVSAAQKKRQATLDDGPGRSTLSDAQKKRQTRVVRSSSPTVSDAQKKRQTRTVKSTSTMSDAQKRRATRITAGPNVGFGPREISSLKMLLIVGGLWQCMVVQVVLPLKPLLKASRAT